MNPIAPLIDWTEWLQFVLKGPGAFMDADKLVEMERDRARVVREIEDWRIQRENKS